MKENDIKRCFVESPNFTKKWTAFGLNDSDLLKLEMELLNNPKTGAVMQGTGGLRKCRISINADSGKSGGARVLYIDFEIHETILFVDVFSKNEKENLSKEERNIIKKTIPILEQELFGGNRHE